MNHEGTKNTKESARRSASILDPVQGIGFFVARYRLVGK